MVDVEQSALRAFQEHGLAGLQGTVEQQAGVGDAVRETFRLSQQRLGDLIRVERFSVVDLDQDLVLELQRRGDLGGQQFGVAHIGHPDADPRDLVLVTRTDAAAGRADLLAAQIALGDFVDGHVIRHQQVRVRGDQQPGGVHPAVIEAAQFGQQHSRVDDDSVADDVGDTRRQDARRDEVQREVVPVGQHHGVPGVVSALVAHHPLHASTE